MSDSYLDEGFLLDKKIGVNQPKRIENAKILVANTPMDTDKVKVSFEWTNYIMLTVKWNMAYFIHWKK